MKKIKSVVLSMWLIIVIIAPQVIVNAQPLTDSTVNYFTLTAYYDNYFDSLMQVRGVENMNGTGYKDYLRWKWLYNGRHGEDGELGAVWDSINSYMWAAITADFGKLPMAGKTGFLCMILIL
jgi:hypothetical protein